MPPFRRPSEHSALCGADCRYRDLYEGAQASLAEMATSQARALARASALRDGIVTVLRTSMPRSFNDLESQIGQRIALADDDAILSYLAYLVDLVLGGDIDQDNWPGRESLRLALEEIGVDASSNDPADWAAGVTKWGARQRAEATAEQLPVPTKGRTTRTLAESRIELDKRQARSLAQVAKSKTEAEAATEPVDETTPPPTTTNAQRSGTTAATASAPDDESWMSLPDDWEPLAETQNWNPPNEKDVIDFDSDSGTSPSLDEGSAPQNTSASDEQAASDAQDLEDITPFGEEPSDDSFSDIDDDFGFNPEDADPEGRTDITDSNDEAATPGAALPALLDEAQPKVVKKAFRPDLFGGGSVKSGSSRTTRKRRTPRVAATPPSGLDVPNEVTTAGLDDSTKSLIDAAVTHPHPVFVGDLCETFDRESVEAWEEEHRRDGSVVKFVAPKARHRLKGSLVVLQDQQRAAATEFQNTFWGECLTTYRGARLYEMAVVAHAFGDRIATHRISADGHIAQLRLTETRGILGVLLVTANDVSDGSAARDALREGIEGFLSDRVEMIVVAPTLDPVYDACVAAVLEDAVTKAWQPPGPIVAARSWEWAGGSSSVLQHLAG